MSRKKTEEEEKVLYLIGWIFLLGLAIVFLCEKQFPDLLKNRIGDCVFHLITGYYCPGCGGTRAIYAMLRGKIILSFLYHPFVIYTSIVGGWFMVSHTIQKITRNRMMIGMKYREVWMWLALGLVVANFVIKNVLLVCGIDVLYML